MVDVRPAQRILSIDAYRGFVMLLMIASGMQLYNVAKKFPDSEAWQVVGFHTNHVPWGGCSLHDTIQPGFSFLVGVALPFSLARRREEGHGFLRRLFHAVVRSLILIALGIFLRSTGAKMTNFTFVDTLTQIGLGYTFLFLLGSLRSSIANWVVFWLIVVCYWSWFTFHPIAVSPDTHRHSADVFEGCLAHWNKNANAASAFDEWFLNQLPREQPFVRNSGGYTTLNFVPTLATMILGLIAGRWMREMESRWNLLTTLLIVGLSGVVMGVLAEYAEVCPIVKPIWTPAWVLFSGGLCFLFLFGFSLLFDGGSPIKPLAMPLVVLGANSIFLYCVNALVGGWLRGSLVTHLAIPEQEYGFKTYEVFGPEYASAVQGGLVILIYWAVCAWMYWKRIFIKI